MLNLCERDLYTALKNSGSVAEQIEWDSPIWRAVAPAIRADFELVGSHQPGEARKVSVPITAIVGADDLRVSLQDMFVLAFRIWMTGRSLRRVKL